MIMLDAKRKILALAMAFLIALMPFSLNLNSALDDVVKVEKNEAHAFAPIAGGAAAAASLAASLGISTEALMTGLVTVTAAATGVYLMNSDNGTLTGESWGNLWDGSDTSINDSSDQGILNWHPDYTGWSMGGGKSWDDLSDAEKANWDTPAEYVQGQWLGYLLQTGLIQEVSGGGGYEPTPEPDQQNDPDGHSKWQRGRNILTVLGVAGGAVALNEASSWLADSISGGIKQLLFGNANDNVILGLDYTGSFVVRNVTIPMVSADISFTNNAGSWNSNTWTYTEIRSNGMQYFYMEPNYNRTYYFSYNNVNWGSSTNSNGVQTRLNDDGTITQSGGGTFSFEVPYYRVTSTYRNYLNSNYIGTYNFGNVATYSNGVWSGDYQIAGIDYGQVNGTPDAITNNVTNNDNYITNVNNYGAVDGDGNRVAIPTPSSFPIDNPSYSDFVSTLPDADVTPTPENDVVTPGDVVNGVPGESPGGEDTPGTDSEQFKEDYERTAMELLAQPFNNLFPFCLIGDLSRLLDMVKDAIYPQTNGLSTQSAEVVNGTTELRIPLDGFGIGLEDIVLDLTYIKTLANSVRGMMTALFICGLLIGTFRFFLTRGGE